MKHLAVTVTGTGDCSELTVIALVCLGEEELETLAASRRVAAELSAQLKRVDKSLVCLRLQATNVHWLIVDYSDADEATGKIYEKLCDSADGFIELPEDVYEGRLRKHHELYRTADSGGMLRTELDSMEVTESGIYFICVEKHCYARHETNLIPWRVLCAEH